MTFDLPSFDVHLQEVDLGVIIDRLVEPDGSYQEPGRSMAFPKTGAYIVDAAATEDKLLGRVAQSDLFDRDV